MTKKYLLTSTDLIGLDIASMEIFIKEKVYEKIKQISNRKLQSYQLNKQYSVTLYEEENLDHIISILDYYDADYFIDKEECNYIKSENGIFYQKEFDIYITNIYNPYAKYNHNLHTAYADNEEKVIRYLKYIKDKQRQRSKENVTVITDTANGIDEEKINITRLVERGDVFLTQKVKEEIFQSIDSFFDEEKNFYTEFDIPYKRGILLYGPPGNGKTTLVKSIASSVKVPVIYYQITEFTTSGTIQTVFNKAAKFSPMVLVIEDVDSMPQRARSTFLNTLDGATSKEGIFLIGTTNYPERVDAALVNRAGRFDQTYEIKLPDLGIRREFLNRKNLNKMVSQEKINDIITSTDGFSIAQLQELYINIAINWHYKRTDKIEDIIVNMKQNIQKQEKAQWNTKSTAETVGFRALSSSQE